MYGLMRSRRLWWELCIREASKKFTEIVLAQLLVMLLDSISNCIEHVPVLGLVDDGDEDGD